MPTTIRSADSYNSIISQHRMSLFCGNRVLPAWSIIGFWTEPGRKAYKENIHNIRICTNLVDTHWGEEEEKRQNWKFESNKILYTECLKLTFCIFGIPWHLNHEIRAHWADVLLVHEQQLQQYYDAMKLSNKQYRRHSIAAKFTCVFVRVFVCASDKGRRNKKKMLISF